MNLFRFGVLFTALLALSAAAHAAVVGRVLMAAGDASVIRNSQELRVAFGSPVEDQDTLKTGPFSNMQVRFTDASVVSLRDNSLLKIDEYKFSGKQDGMERAFFNLVKGGFRTITGLIGKINKSNYAVKTATATIGIRGTNFALLHCTAGNCGAAAKDGLYGGVSGGIIAATNSTGEYQFGSGDYFYIPSKDEPAKKLIGPPRFFADQLTGQGRVEGQQTASAGNEQSQNGGAASDSRPNKVVQPPQQLAFIGTENLGPNGEPPIVIPTSSTSPTVPPAVFPSQGTGGIVYYPLSIATSTGFTISGAFASTNGQMVSFSGLDSFTNVTNVGSIGSASVLDSGGNASAGNLNWGRWLGTGATVNSLAFGLTNNSILHYAIGDPVGTMPTNLGAAVTYNAIGGTTPTNATGFTGNFLGGSVLVNFVTASMATNLQIGFNSATYTMNGSTTYLANGQFKGGLTGTCAGASCGTGTTTPGGVTGANAGSFTGANALGIAMIYHVADPGGPNGDIVGAQGFKR